MTARADSTQSTPDYFRWCVTGAIALAIISPLANAWSAAPDLGHGWLTPLLLAFLWWERWTELPSARPAPPHLVLWGVGLALLGVLMLPVRLLLGPYPFWPSAVALFTLTSIAATLALAWLLAGKAGVKWFGWPLVLLAGAMPWPTSIETTLILPLRELMAQIAAEISNLLGRPALAAGTSIRLGSGWVGIDEACGGIRSLQACVLIGLFFGEWFRLGLARRGALVIAAAGAAVAGNFARVLFLSSRNSAESVTQAHDIAGWAALLVSMLATGVLAWFWAGRRLPAAPLNTPARPAKGPRSKVWVVAAVFASVLLLNEVGTRIWFSYRPSPAAHESQWTARFPSGLKSYQAEPLSDIARDLLRPDVFASGRWRDAQDESIAAYYIEWRKGQTARAIPFLHNPTVCLPLSGCELLDTLPPLEIEVGALRIPFQAYRFRRIDRELLVVFTVWDPTTAAPLKQGGVGGGLQAWTGARWTDVVERKQHQPAQMLAVAIPWSETSEQEMRWLLGKILVPASASSNIQ